jgi:MYXO-CTERM domain-containing protein
VFIDNIYQGVTPLTVTGLGAGDHIVLIRQDGYADWSATVTTIPDKTVTLAATLAGVAPSPTHAPAPVAGAIGALALCGILALRRRN